jgi:uncharacterized integral membrane protein (TIGR00698 family)
MGLAVLAAPLVQRWPTTAPGTQFAATSLLRAGVALLGLRISLGELASLGDRGFVVALTTIAATYAITQRLGSRLGVPNKLTQLIATGSAICGASAIAAMNATAGAREEDVTYAVATVTVFGSFAMLMLPVFSRTLGLTDAQAGMWVGGSVHEVAQATAAGAAISVGALKIATLVKLCRVLLLAPAIATVNARSRGRVTAWTKVPRFLLCFLALAALRSLIPIPGAVLAASATVSTAMLAAGLAALGLRIRPAALMATGPRPLALGLAASVVAGVTALVVTFALTA